MTTFKISLYRASHRRTYGGKLTDTYDVITLRDTDRETANRYAKDKVEVGGWDQAHVEEEDPR